ncbi:MAG: phosphoribosylamine--glycine ligase [Desulfovibrionaceae bacterium]|nr:phosphoribosylamine--glycine ligase [Desulfovibrionaceae bacterium]
MRLLIIGSGGREHALAWRFHRAGHTVFCAPGNGGTAKEGVNIAIADDDIPALVQFARDKSIDLVVPGPELPLTLGITDAMKEAGIRCFGPDRYCAQLEGSKSFAKDVMKRSGVPTAPFEVFSSLDQAETFIRKQGAPLVIKADGLAAGKGVIIAQSEKEALDAVRMILKEKAFGNAGSQVVIERFLCGEEVSLLAFCSGEQAVPLPSAQDHKAAFDGDTGPNTGGMGAYSPAPVLPDTDLERISDLVIRPILHCMAKDGHPYTGILYAGLMMTEDGPMVLEYNVRFGDPECQPLLMRLETDPAEIMMACIEHNLDAIPLSIRQESALGVVIVADGYPGKYPKGMEIHGLEEADTTDNITVFQAGTVRDGNLTKTNGGRILCVTALGKDLEEAQKRAYNTLPLIDIKQTRYRTDIGQKGLRRS